MPKLLNLPPIRFSPETLKIGEDISAFEKKFGAVPIPTMQQRYEDFVAGVRRALSTGDPTGVRTRKPGILAD